MRRALTALSVLGLLSLGGIAHAKDSHPTQVNPDGTTEHITWEQRGIFNAVKVRKDYRAICNGAEPINVDVFHTVGDGFAAVFTGILWTPAHVRVTCPATTATQPLL
jgi:hypothetical protein